MIFTSGAIGLNISNMDTQQGVFYLLPSGNELQAWVSTLSGNTKIFSERSSTLLLNGTGVPSSSIGYSGDFFINTSSPTYDMYGPKPSTTGNWLTGVGQYLPLSVSGATGLTGPTGVSGARGSGVASGGFTNQTLVKSSDTSYATEWANPVDVLNYNKKLTMGHYTQSSRKRFVDLSGAVMNYTGASITYSEISNCFYVTSDVGGLPTICEYSPTFELLRTISVPLSASDTLYGIDWYRDNYFLITSADGAADPKIHLITLYDFQGGVDPAIEEAELVETYPTLLPAAAIVTGIAVDRKNNYVYFCTEESIGGVWNIYRAGLDDIASDQTAIFDIEASGLDGSTIFSSLRFSDLSYSKDDNTLTCLLRASGISAFVFLEINLANNEIVNDANIVDGSFDPTGFSRVVFISPGGQEFSSPAGMCFSNDRKNLYLTSLTPGDPSYICCFTHGKDAEIINDSTIGRIAVETIYGHSLLPLKYYETLDAKTSITGSSTFPPTKYFGSPNSENFFPGTVIKSEAFGNLSTSKITSVFPNNCSTSDTTSPFYTTGSYYLSLPSGLSNVNWRYESETIARDQNPSQTGKCSKTIYAKFEVFGPSKLELCYIETGTYQPASPIDSFDTSIRFTFAASGSGTINLYNQRLSRF